MHALGLFAACGSKGCILKLSDIDCYGVRFRSESYILGCCVTLVFLIHAFFAEMEFSCSGPWRCCRLGKAGMLCGAGRYIKNPVEMH